VSGGYLPYHLRSEALHTFSFFIFVSIFFFTCLTLYLPQGFPMFVTFYLLRLCGENGELVSWCEG